MQSLVFTEAKEGTDINKYPMLKNIFGKTAIVFSNNFNCCQKYKEIDIEFVIDKNSFGDIMGIEILNLKNKLGDRVISDVPWLSNEISYSYDDENDSFYVYLRKGEYSSFQEVIKDKILLDENGVLMALFVC